MPREANIEVHVQVNGKNLTEYIDPHEIATDGGARIFYIEAISGQTFTVSAKFLAGFPLRGADVLNVKLKFDDCSQALSLRRDIYYLPRTLGCELARDAVIDFKSCSVKDATGRWKQGILTFGDLELDETLPKDHFSAEQAIELGRIYVEVYKARRVPRRVPYVPDEKSMSMHTKVNRKLYEGKEIKNIVDIKPSCRDGHPPRAKLYDYIAVSKADVRVFEFRYRTRRALQNMGLISRSPSPEQDRRAALERTERMLKEMKERERRATLRNAELEKRLADMEQSHSPNLENKKRKQEGDDDEVQEVASPQRPAPVFIDLVDDGGD